jgi:hypothetical protein
MSELPYPAKSTAVSVVIEDVGASEGWNLLQKGLFLAVIVGCIAVYVRKSRVNGENNHGYEKGLA